MHRLERHSVQSSAFRRFGRSCKFSLGSFRLVGWSAAVLVAPLSSLAASYDVSSPIVVDTRIGQRDFDGDRMPDSYEQSMGLDWQLNDAASDPDADGLTNLEEYNRGTDPRSADIPSLSQRTSRLFAVSTGGLTHPLTADLDADGMPDWWELRYGFDITVNDAGLDSDLDGKSNLSEYLTGANPLLDDRLGQHLSISPFFETDTGGKNRDTDGDGLPNWWERFYFDNDQAAVRSGDPDGDRHTNFDEFLTGTHPLDRRSVLSIIEVKANADSIILRWSSAPSHTYSLWQVSQTDFTFHQIASNLVATPPINSFTNRLTSARDIYRVSTGR